MAWNIEGRGTAKEIRETLKSQLDQADANTKDAAHENRHTLVTAKVVDAVLKTLEDVAPNDEVTVSAGSSAGQVSPGTLRPEFTQIDVVVRLAAQTFAKTSPAKGGDEPVESRHGEKQPANVIDE